MSRTEHSPGAADGASIVSPPLADLFRYGFASYPFKVAIDDGRSRYTFLQLEHGARRIAARLIQAGLRPGERVAVLAPKRAYLPMIAVAIWKAGGVYSPIDPDNPAPRLSGILDVLAPRLVLGPEKAIEGLSSTASIASLGFSHLLDVALAEEEERPTLPLAADLRDIAYVIFTSGSTGVPKGVQISHAALQHYFVAHNEILRFDAASRVLSVSPFFFDVSIEDTLLPLSSGAFVYQFAGLPVPDVVLKLLSDHEISHFIAVSTFLHAISKNQALVKRHRLPHLRLLMTGAEVCNPAVIDLWQTAHPGVRIFNAYGPTEATIVCLCHEISDEEIGRDKAYPIGKPLRGTSVLLMGADDEEWGPDTEGELWISGPQLMSGYLGDREATAEKLVRRGDTVWYRSGDWCRRDENGNLHFLERLDSQVKVGGRRIELEEIEALARTVRPGLHVLAGLVRTERNEARLALVALNVDDDELLEDIERVLRQHLPGYMIPAVWAWAREYPAAFVGSSGKTDRARIFDALGAAWRGSRRDRYCLKADGAFA